MRKVLIGFTLAALLLIFGLGGEGTVQFGMRLTAIEQGFRLAARQWDWQAAPREAVAMTADTKSARKPRQEPSPEPARRRR